MVSVIRCVCVKARSASFGSSSNLILAHLLPEQQEDDQRPSSKCFYRFVWPFHALHEADAAPPLENKVDVDHKALM